MRHARWFGLAVVAALFVTAAPAWAQVQKLVKVDVPFQFVVAGKTLPAGTYDFALTGTNLLQLRDSSGKGQALAYVTRLAQREGTPTPSELIFDKTGNQNVLSEIWSTGQDGFFIAGTSGVHTHVRVKGSPDQAVQGQVLRSRTAQDLTLAHAPPTCSHLSTRPPVYTTRLQPPV